MKLILSTLLLVSVSLSAAQEELDCELQEGAIGCEVVEGQDYSPGLSTGRDCPDDQYYCPLFKSCVPTSYDCSW
ncbi:hypothetical protein K2X33_03735 [bacterium]|nr:hypothetical protein [bacterium]